MASVTITHRHVSGKPAGSDPNRVYGTHWDDTHSVTGLENVDNTSDANKPISTATQAALDAKQPLDATLTALAGVTTAADKVIYATGADTFATTDLTSTARSLLDDTSTSAMRTTLGVAIGADVQAFDSDLSAVAGLSTTGLIARTGSGTAATRTVTAPAAGITVSNGDGVSGNPTLALANDLSALEGLASTGIAVRTTTDTWAQRTLQAPAAGLTITNPAGVAGDPTFALANDLAAVEGLSGTGIARRTGTDAWSAGTAVSNSELATAAAYTLKGNATDSSATPTDISISALTAKTTPAAGDYFLVSDSAASGALKKVDATNVAAASGVSSFNGDTGAITLYSQPQGRLTLTSGTAVPTSDVAGATTLYYTPAVGGGYVPITADGTTFSMRKFAEVSQTTTDTTKSPAACVANANYDIFAWSDSGTNRISRGDYWKASGTATMTIASPCVVTCGTANWNTNYNPPIVFTTTGALPTGITAGATYYLKPITATTANISSTPGGSSINTSGSQSGTHTATYGDDFGTSYRSGSTSLTAVGGLLLNTSSITNGPAASRGTYVGTVRTNASSTLDLTFGTATSGGGAALVNVYNQYNQVQMATYVSDTSAAWSYTTATTRMSNNSAGNRSSFLQGMATNPLTIARGGHIVTAAASGAYAFLSYGLDSITQYANQSFVQAQNMNASANNFYFSPCNSVKPMLGAHFVQALELGDGTNANQFDMSSGAQALVVTTWQ